MTAAGATEVDRAAPLTEHAARAAVVAALLLASYWKIVDAETYMRLAIGRFVASGGLGGEDPFLFSIPGLPWRSPEWLGDLLFWGTYRVAGEAGLVALKLLVTSVGWLMLYQLARRRGGPPVVIVALAMLVLAGSEWHMSERNEMHLHWLVPAYGLVLDRARRDHRWLWALAPLGMLWANLHGSFVFSWVLVGAELAEALFGEDRDRGRARTLAVALLAHPLLGFASPEGPRIYHFIYEHYRYGAQIKRLIREWQPPEREAATLAQLPLHLLGIVGLLSFLPRPNRRQVGGVLVFIAGLWLAYGAQRFLLLFGLLALPVVAGNLGRMAPLLPLWPRRLLAGALLAAGVALIAPAAVAARRLPHAADQPDYPSKPAAWISAHAPPGSRLFMPYTGSQWLMWLAPQVRLYIHPQLTYSPLHMIRFFGDVIPHPARFEEEVRRLDITLAMPDLVGEMPALQAHLDGARDEWALVFFDGFHALYARRIPTNQAFIDQHAFHVLRGRLSYDYLGPVTDEALAPDLRRLDAEAPVVAGTIRAFRLLRGPPSREAGLRARELLRPILHRKLPLTAALIAYLVEAEALAGDLPAAAAALERGLAIFPTSRRLQALAEQLRPPRPR